MLRNNKYYINNNNASISRNGNIYNNKNTEYYRICNDSNYKYANVVDSNSINGIQHLCTNDGGCNFPAMHNDEKNSINVESTSVQAISTDTFGNWIIHKNSYSTESNRNNNSDLTGITNIIVEDNFANKTYGIINGMEDVDVNYEKDEKCGYYCHNYNNRDICECIDIGHSSSNLHPERSTHDFKVNQSEKVTIQVDQMVPFCDSCSLYNMNGGTYVTHSTNFMRDDKCLIRNIPLVTDCHFHSSTSVSLEVQASQFVSSSNNLSSSDMCVSASSISSDSSLSKDVFAHNSDLLSISKDSNQTPISSMFELAVSTKYPISYNCNSSEISSNSLVESQMLIKKRPHLELGDLEAKKQRILNEFLERQKVCMILNSTHSSLPSFSLSSHQSPVISSPISTSLSSTLSTSTGAISSSSLSTELPIYKSRLTYLFIRNTVVRQAVLGASNFLIATAANLQLSLSTICTALVYLHRFYEEFRFEGTERKYVAAACLLLAWKYREDMESSRCSRKLFILTKSVYRVMCSKNGSSNNTCSLDVKQDNADLASLQHSPGKMVAKNEERNDEVVSVSKWILKDHGKEFNTIRERIKIYESALLRALDYKIGPIPLPFPLLSVYTRKFIWCCFRYNYRSQKNIQSKLQSRATMLILDCYRTPLCLEYSESEITIGCTWRAAVVLNIIGRSEQNSISNNNTVCEINSDIFANTLSVLQDYERCINDWLTSLKLWKPLEVNRVRRLLFQLRSMYLSINAFMDEEL